MLEFLIAIALGLTIISGSLTVFTASRKSIELNTALTDIQDSARFAMDTITRDIRMAGFQGCIDINTLSAKILAIEAPTDNLLQTAISASLIDENDTWLPTAPDGFSIPTDVGAPVVGTHALSVQFGSPQTGTIQPMTAVDADIVVDNSDSGFAAGDLILISNCQIADIFEITSVSGKKIRHASEGNSDKRLSAPYGQGNDNQARIMRFEANIYYIGDTQRTNSEGDQIFSLYKQSLPYTNAPIEMIEGVANMKIRLGIRDLGESNDNGLTFVAPEDLATNNGRIDVVQFGLLLQSHESILEQDDNSTYAIAGTRLSPEQAPADPTDSYPSDRRMKLAFNSAVKIRNRR